MVCELVSPVFYRIEYTFDGVSLAAGNRLEPEVMAVEDDVQPRRRNDQQNRIVVRMLLAEFSKKFSVSARDQVANSLSWRNSVMAGSTATSHQ